MQIHWWPAALDSEMLLPRWRMALAKEVRPWLSTSTCVVFAVHNVPAIITNYFLLNLFGRKLSMNDNIQYSQYSLVLKYVTLHS